MNKEEMMKIFEDAEAIITGSHIVYASGRHGSMYINKDAVYPHTASISKLCKEMAERFKGRGVEVVAGPTVGGVILSQWVAHFLSELDGKNVLAVFAEENETKDRFFKRGYDKLIAGKKVLIVEDVLTTGGSVKKVVDAVINCSGDVAGCIALCNRGGVTAGQVGAQNLTSLIELNLESWEEAECPLCKKGVPVNTNVGKGREYLTKRT